MAIAIRAVSAWVAATNATQTVTLPTHIAGDMMLVRVVAKGPVTLANNLVICNTSGWTAVGAMYFGGTAASTNGDGSVWARAFYKIATSSAEASPVLTFQNPSGTNVAMLPSAAVAISYSKGSTETWETPVGGGGQISASTAISAAISAFSTAVGDMIDAFVGTNDNTTLTVPTFTQFGMTFATVTESPATALSSATSNDISADGCYRLATAGTSSSSVVITGTNSVADQGAGWATRLRVLTATAKDGTAETGTASDTATAPDVARSATAETGTGADTASLAVARSATAETGTGADTATGYGPAPKDIRVMDYGTSST